MKHSPAFTPAQRARDRRQLDLALDLAANSRPRRRPSDVSAAARELGLRRAEIARKPILARARQICAELGIPVPPALQERGR
jgi:hypothetical protein